MLAKLDALKKYEDVGLFILRMTVALLLAVRQGWPTFLQFLEGSTEFPDPLHIGARAAPAAGRRLPFACLQPSRGHEARRAGSAAAGEAGPVVRTGG